jgi:hypothetical protein
MRFLFDWLMCMFHGGHRSWAAYGDDAKHLRCMDCGWIRETTPADLEAPASAGQVERPKALLRRAA